MIIITKTTWIIKDEMNYLSLSYEKLITNLSIYITNNITMIEFYNIFDKLSINYNFYTIYYYKFLIHNAIFNTSDTNILTEPQYYESNYNESNYNKTNYNETNLNNCNNFKNDYKKDFIIVCYFLNINPKILISSFDLLEQNYGKDECSNFTNIFEEYNKITILELLLILLFKTKFANKKLLFNYPIALFVLMDYLQKNYLSYNVLKLDIENILLKHEKFNKQHWKSNFIKLYFLQCISNNK